MEIKEVQGKQIQDNLKSARFTRIAAPLLLVLGVAFLVWNLADFYAAPNLPNFLYVVAAVGMLSLPIGMWMDSRQVLDRGGERPNGLFMAGGVAAHLSAVALMFTVRALEASGSQDMLTRAVFAAGMWLAAGFSLYGLRLARKERRQKQP